MIYVPGKSHDITDALSRAPIFSVSDDLDIQVDTALAHLTTARNPALSIIYEAVDEDYKQCIIDIESNTATSTLSQQLKSVKGDVSTRDNLILLDATRIVLPKAASNQF